MFKIIGDSSIINLPDDEENNIYVFKNNMTLDVFLKENFNFFTERCKNDSLIVYSFGFNDKRNGRSSTDIILDYEKLPRGKNKTIIVIPQNQDLDFFEECNELLDDNFIFVTTLLEYNDVILSSDIIKDENINRCLMKEIINKCNDPN